DLPLLECQLPERLIHGDLVALRDGLDEIVIEIGRAPQGADRAIGEWPALVRDDEVRVDLELAPQPRARGARAMRVIERKVARRELFHGEAVVGAGKILTEE